MTKRRELRNFRRLLLTNRVEFDSLQFQSVLGYVRASANVPAIVVVRIERALPKQFLIVDGNHRAVAHAFLKRPVRYFEILSQKDIDRILAIEQRGGFASFPHRSFLTGEKDLETLIHEAVVAAASEMKCVTALDLALQLDEAERGVDSSATEKNIERCRFVSVEIPSIRQSSAGTPDSVPPEYPPSIHNVGIEPEWRRSGSPSNSHEPRYTTNRFPSRDSRARAESPSSRDVTRWIAAVRRQFNAVPLGEEFPCAYSTFASICQEDKNRGPTISKNLVDVGLIERVRIGEVETGESYSSGKPITQRITYWRFLE